MNPDAKVFQTRIIKRPNAKITIAARHEHVRGAKVRDCRTRYVDPRWDLYYHIANPRLQSVAKKLVALREPEVRHIHAEITGCQFCQSILEALLLLVGVRQVVRIGTNSQFLSGREDR